MNVKKKSYFEQKDRQFDKHTNLSMEKFKRESRRSKKIRVNEYRDDVEDYTLDELLSATK